MAAASMLRGAASSALRHRLPVISGSAAAFPMLRGGLLHNVVGAGSSPLAPPAAAAAMAMAASAPRHLSTTKPSAPEVEKKKKKKKKQQALAKLDAAKADLLQQLVLELEDDNDATAGGRSKLDKARLARTTKEVSDFLIRRQVQAGPAAPPAEDDTDKHLLLALLVRSAMAEQEVEKLRSSAARAEQEMEKLKADAAEIESARRRPVFVDVVRDILFYGSLVYLTVKFQTINASK